MLIKNEVLHWKNRDFRVLHWDGKQVFVYFLDSESSCCNAFDFKELSQAKADGLAVAVKDPYAEARSRMPTGQTKVRTEEAYQLIAPIVANPLILYDPHRRREMLRLAGGDLNVLSKMQRLIRLWWLKGQTPNALIPEYGHNTGRRDTQKKVGRQSSATSKVPPVNESLRKEFDAACRKHLLVSNHKSIHEAYVAFLDDYRRDHPDVPPEEHPTERQFSYYWQTAYTKAEKARKRNSLISYNKDVRALTGNVYDTVSHPGAIYEVDSTLADIHLVAEDDRTAIIGRPTLYLVTDRFTGMIVGFDVSLNPPQFKGAADAIYCAVRDKTEVAKELGIEGFKPEDWPCSGLPSQIVADNAELATGQAEYFASVYGTALVNTPSYRGDRKGTVEEELGRVQQLIGSYNPPGIPDKIKLKKAGGKDTRLDACLSLKEYRQIVFHTILERNRHCRTSVPKGYPADEGPRAFDLWMWYWDRGFCAAKQVSDLQGVRLALLPRYPASVSREGINVLHLRYQCKEALDQGLLERRLESERPKGMEAVLDPADVSRAWLIPDPSKPAERWECKLAPDSRNLEGMTLKEAQDYLKIQTETRANTERANAELEAQTRRKCRNIITKAQEESAAAEKPCARKRLGDIAANRAKEQVKAEKEKPRVPKAPKPLAQEPQKAPEDFSYPDDLDSIPD